MQIVCKNVFFIDFYKKSGLKGWFCKLTLSLAALDKDQNWNILDSFWRFVIFDDLEWPFQTFISWFFEWPWMTLSPSFFNTAFKCFIFMYNWTFLGSCQINALLEILNYFNYIFSSSNFSFYRRKRYDGQSCYENLTPSIKSF